MAVVQLLVNAYAGNVYMTGNNSLSNIEAMRPEYVQPVKERAAKVYYIDDIDRALTYGWITPEEHAETLVLKTPNDPQYLPRIKSAEEQM